MTRTLVRLGWLPLALVMAVVACDGGDNGGTQTGGEEPAVVTTVPEIPPPFNFTISAACQAVVEITELNLVRGQTVTYCNKWAQMSTLKFSVAGFLPDGATQVDLATGECVTWTITTDVATGEYTWSLTCQGNTAPSGGGPV